MSQWLASSTALMAAGIVGATGVGLGAFGAHALRAKLTAAATTSTWDTAVQYHLLHAVVLLIVGLWLRAVPTSQALSVAALLLVAGVLLFSGSLYGLALGGPRWLGPITPLGGLCLIGAWCTLAWAAMNTGAPG